MNSKTHFIGQMPGVASESQQDTETALAFPLLEAEPIPWAGEATRIEAMWSASQDVDNPTFRPRDGWWSLHAWATATRILFQEGFPTGVAAIQNLPDAEVAEARLALLPAFRQPTQAVGLIDHVLDLTQEAGLARVRLYVPSTASWAIAAAQQRGFSLLRTQHVMLRSASANPLSLPPLKGVYIRRLHAGEEVALLRVLNRAWSDTWNFRPLTLEALLADLEGQRAGFFVAVEEANERHIVGTIHALFDCQASNPDKQPYAWISNLTTDPAWRGRGLGRALLACRLNHLSTQGARSVTLGVVAERLLCWLFIILWALRKSVPSKSGNTSTFHLSDKNGWHPLAFCSLPCYSLSIPPPGGYGGI